VYWYRDDNVVNYSGRKGIHIWTGDAVPKDIDKLDETSLDDDTTNVTTTVTSTTMSQFSVTEVSHQRHSATRLKSTRRKNRIRPIVVSMLEIQMVMPDDAGSYTCAPSNARNHSAVVHVIQGESGSTVKPGYNEH
jgi:hypothetical protein